MRIYDGDFTVSNILEDILPPHPNRASALAFDGTPMRDPLHTRAGGKKHPMDTPINLAALNARIGEIPVVEIRRRRTRMNTFYEEVLVSADPDRGVEFTSLLMILAHYKVINDNKSLRLEEFLRRRARLQRVDEAVCRNVVVGFFDTLYWSRRFRREIKRRKQSREESYRDGRLTGIPQLDVPEIFVHDESDDDDGKSSRTGGFDDDNSMPPTPIDKEGVPAWHDIPISPTGDDGEHSRGRSNSVQFTPNASPTRSRFARSRSRSRSPTNSNANTATSMPHTPQPLPESWQFANALIGDGEGRRSPSASPKPSPHSSAHLDPFDFSPAFADGSADLGLGSLNFHNSSNAGLPTARATNTVSLAVAGPSRSRAPTLSVPVGAGEGGSVRDSASGRSRATSSVSARDMVLGELENSAWGESIRRSFTTVKRQSGVKKKAGSGKGSPTPSPGR